MIDDVAIAREAPHIDGTLSFEHIRRDPLLFLEGQVARAGDVFAYELGGFRALFLGRPEHARHVLQTNARNYVKSGTPDLMMLAPMLGNGLMTSEGAAWREQRTIVQPAFHRERIELLVADMARFTDEMADGWKGTVDVEAEMSRLTLKVIAWGLFGYELRNRSTDFAGAVTVMNEFMAHFDPDDRQKLAAFRHARGTVAGITQEILDARRTSSRKSHDLLSMLIAARHEDGSALTDAEIRDQIFTFLMAGHETTAKTLTWTLYLLGLHRDVRARVREEARRVLSPRPTAAESERLEYAWMVVQETMRLYPPVWLMSRIAAADDVVGGFRIPAGHLVVVSPWILHRDARSWSDPLRFDPERFAPARAPQISEYVYMPFSGGPRACVGRRFATLETKIVLATLVRRLDLDLLPGHPVEPEALVTLRPRYGMPMTATVTS
jgi:cytochrome P450